MLGNQYLLPTKPGVGTTEKGERRWKANVFGEEANAFS